MPDKYIEVTIRDESVLKILGNLDKLDQAVLVNVIDAVNKSAQSVAGAASTKYAPIRKGDLRGSIGVNIELKASGSDLLVQADIYAAEPYAKSQHENEDFKHPDPPNNPEAGAHYLTRPLEEQTDAIQRLVAEAIGNSLNGAL